MCSREHWHHSLPHSDITVTWHVSAVYQMWCLSGGGPNGVTNTRALQTAKCANGLANAAVFTSGLTTHACSTCQVIPAFTHTHSVTAQVKESDINTQNG